MEKTSKEILLDIFDDCKKQLELSSFSVHDFKEISYGIQFTVLQKGSSVGTIRIYRNNKGVVKYDYSQLKDESKRLQVAHALQGNGELESNDQIEPDNSLFWKASIGTDESGKGDYFGPLVTAAVYVDERTKTILDRSGIQDSKKINDTRIFELANVIKKFCPNQYVVIEIPPNTYNDLYIQFKNEGKNLNVLLAWSHAKAIEELLDKVKCDIAISDQFADEKFILSKLQEKGRSITLIQEHKAERYTSVAAASILARARFLEKIKRLGQEFSMEFSKGASNLVVQQAKKFVETHGIDSLRRVAKLHFKTTEQVS